MENGKTSTSSKIANTKSKAAGALRVFLNFLQKPTRKRDSHPNNASSENETPVTNCQNEASTFSGFPQRRNAFRNLNRFKLWSSHGCDSGLAVKPTDTPSHSYKVEQNNDDAEDNEDNVDCIIDIDDDDDDGIADANLDNVDDEVFANDSYFEDDYTEDFSGGSSSSNGDIEIYKCCDAPVSLFDEAFNDCMGILEPFHDNLNALESVKDYTKIIPESITTNDNDLLYKDHNLTTECNRRYSTPYDLPVINPKRYTIGKDFVSDLDANAPPFICGQNIEAPSEMQKTEAMSTPDSNGYSSIDDVYITPMRTKNSFSYPKTIISSPFENTLPDPQKVENYHALNVEFENRKNLTYSVGHEPHQCPTKHDVDPWFGSKQPPLVIEESFYVEKTTAVKITSSMSSPSVCVNQSKTTDTYYRRSSSGSVESGYVTTGGAFFASTPISPFPSPYAVLLSDVYITPKQDFYDTPPGVFYASQQDFHIASQQDFHTASQQDFHTTSQQDFYSTSQQDFYSASQQNFHTASQQDFHMASQQDFHTASQQDFHTAPQQDFHTASQQNFHTASQQDFHTTSQQDFYSASQQNFYSASQQDFHIASQQDFHIASQQDSHIASKQDFHIAPQQDFHIAPQQDFHIASQQDFHIASQQDFHIASQQDFHTASQQDFHIAPQQDFHIASQQDFHIASQQDFHTASQQDFHTASQQDFHTASQQDFHIASQQDFHIASQQDFHNASQQDFHNASQQDFHNASQQDFHNASQQDFHTASQQDLYTSPQRDLYTSPQRDLYTSPQRDLYTSPQRDLYASPQRDLYASPQQDLYTSPQQDLYISPQQDFYTSLKQGLFSAHQQGLYSAPQQDLYSAPQQDLYSAPQQDLYSAPQQDLYSAPEQDLYSAPQQDLYSAPQQDLYAAPQQDLYAAPQQDLYDAPQQDLYDAPQQDLYSAPQQDLNSAPQQDLHSAPEQNLYSAPQQDLYSAPQEDSYSAAQQDLYSEPEQDLYAAPQQDLHSAPQQDLYSAPQQDSYAAPQHDSYAAPPTNLDPTLLPDLYTMSPPIPHIAPLLNPSTACTSRLCPQSPKSKKHASPRHHPYIERLPAPPKSNGVTPLTKLHSGVPLSPYSRNTLDGIAFTPKSNTPRATPRLALTKRFEFPTTNTSIPTEGTTMTATAASPTEDLKLETVIEIVESHSTLDTGTKMESNDSEPDQKSCEANASDGQETAHCNQEKSSPSLNSDIQNKNAFVAVSIVDVLQSANIDEDFVQSGSLSCFPSSPPPAPMHDSQLLDQPHTPIKASWTTLDRPQTMAEYLNDIVVTSPFGKTLRPICTSSPIPNKFLPITRRTVADGTAFTDPTTKIQIPKLNFEPPVQIHCNEPVSPSLCTKKTPNKLDVDKIKSKVKRSSSDRRKKLVKRKSARARLNFDPKNLNDSCATRNSGISTAQLPKSTDYVLLKRIAEDIVRRNPYLEWIHQWVDVPSLMENLNSQFGKIMESKNFKTKEISRVSQLKENLQTDGQALFQKITVENCLDVALMALLVEQSEKVSASINFIFENLQRVFQIHSSLSHLSPEIVMLLLSNRRSMVENNHGFPLSYFQSEKEVIKAVVKYVGSIRKKNGAESILEWRVQNMLSYVIDPYVLTPDSCTSSADKRLLKEFQTSITRRNFGNNFGSVALSKRPPPPPPPPPRQPHKMIFKTSSSFHPFPTKTSRDYLFQPFLSPNIHSLDDIGIAKGTTSSTSNQTAPPISLREMSNENYVLRKLYFSYRRCSSSNAPFITKIGMQYSHKGKKKSAFIAQCRVDAEFDNTRYENDPRNIDTRESEMSDSELPTSVESRRLSSLDVKHVSGGGTTSKPAETLVKRAAVILKAGEHVTALSVLGQRALHNIEIVTNTGRRIRAHSIQDVPPDVRWVAIATPNGNGPFCLHTLYGDLHKSSSGRATIRDIGALWISTTKASGVMNNIN